MCQQLPVAKTLWSGSANTWGGPSFPMKHYLTVGKGTVVQPNSPENFHELTNSWKTDSGSTRKKRSDRLPTDLPLAMPKAVGTSCGKSQTGVMSVVSGWSHLHYICHTICHSEVFFMADHLNTVHVLLLQFQWISAFKKAPTQPNEPWLHDDMNILTCYCTFGWNSSSLWNLSYFSFNKKYNSKNMAHAVFLF